MNDTPWLNDAPVAGKRPAPSATNPWDADKPTGERPNIAALLTPTGQAHDGDTFGLSGGQSARLYGYDAFELNQTGRSRSGAVVPLGQQARTALLPFVQPGASVTPTGSASYNRPVVSLNSGGIDPVVPLLRDGRGIAAPTYLKSDPIRLGDYMEAERFARLNGRGAWKTQFVQPSSYRHKTPDPWAKAQLSGAPGADKQAVFWDEPTPFQGLRPDVAAGYEALQRDPNATAKDLIDYSRANGFKIDEAAATRYISRRNDPRFKTSVGTRYSDPPRVLTDPGDGKLGAFARGVADPINMLDEMGGVVDSIVPNDRENIWDSDRRFGDIYSNNVDQNRSILAYDDSAHPWARFGGQLASGLVMPGASVEGLGAATARRVLESGGSRFAAEQAARTAVVKRLALAGAAEGGLAGVGAGEDAKSRFQGALIGAPAGAVLGAGAGTLAPKVAAIVGRPFSRLAGRDGEAAAQDFTDGAIDTARARASNDIQAPASPGVSPSVMAMDNETLPATLVGPEMGGPLPRPRAPVSPTMSAVDEGSSLGPKSVLSFVPRTGEPGVSVINNDGHLAIAVYRDGDGVARGAAQIPLTPEARESFDSASVYVAPELRRKGVASQLYDALEREGYPIGVQSGSGDLTPDGAGFVSAWRSRGQPAGPRTPDRIDVNARPRPLLDPATEAQRRAQAATMMPGDVMPLPANRVDGIDEAMRIDAGRIAPVRAPDEMAELSRRNLPSPVDGTRTIPKRGPVDLVTYLRTQGGLRGNGGDLQHLGIDNAPRNGMDFAGGEQRFGRLVDPNGMGYDEAATRAWEEGYFPDHAEPPSISEFIDALDATHSGRNRSFLPDDLDEVDRFAAARQQRYDVEAAAQEGDPLYQDRSEPVTEADLDKMSAPVTAYEEWGENAPRLAGNLRLDKLDSPESIKRALVATHARVGGFDPATRGRITQAETKALADDLGMTADDLLARRKGSAFNAEEALAARQILAKSSAELVRMARRISQIDHPGDEAEAAFREAWLRHAAIQEQVAGMTAEAGRALAQFRQVASSKGVGRVLPNFGEIAGGLSRMKDVADRIVDLEHAGKGPGDINKFALAASRTRGRDMLIELYYNSLLSGPATHAVNILSNTMTALSQIPEYAVASAIGGVRRGVQELASRYTGTAVGSPDRVIASELGARAVGMIQGTKTGLVEAARTMRTGMSSDPFTKVENASDKAIPGIVGSVIRTPTRMLAAEDELFKGVARQMALNGLATRRVGLQGLKGQEAKRAIANLLADPPEDLQKEARDYSRYATFTQPLGPAARGISQFTENWPAAKLVIPFVRTPLNIFKYAVERSPLAPLLKEWRRDLQAGGSRGDLAMAKMMIGSGIGAAVIEATLSGHITGGGPADDGAKRLLKANGWQPYSFKVGDQYYSYSRLDPLALTIGTAADMVDLQSEMTDKQRENAAALVAASVAGNLSNKTWLSGISNMMEAFSDPDRSWGQFVSNMVASIAVPAIVGQTARATDPLIREARTITDTIRSRVPGLSQSLPVRRDVFGAAMQREGGVGPDVMSPVVTKTDRKDKTIAALLASSVSIGAPSRTYTEGRKRKEWTPSQYDRLTELAGTKAKPELDALVASPVWEWMDDDERAAEVASVMKRARGEAKGELLTEPGREVARALIGQR